MLTIYPKVNSQNTHINKLNTGNYSAKVNNSTVRPIQPNFCGGEDIISKMISREVTMVSSYLSRDAKTKLGTTIFKEGNKGVSGWLLNKLCQFEDYLLKNDSKGTFEMVMGTQEDLIAQRAEDVIANTLQDYMAKVFKSVNGKGDANFVVDNFDSKTRIAAGNGFKIRLDNQRISLELDSNVRAPLVELLEKSKTYQEIKNGLDKFKPILDNKTEKEKGIKSVTLENLIDEIK